MKNTKRMIRRKDKEKNNHAAILVALANKIIRMREEYYQKHGEIQEFASQEEYNRVQWCNHVYQNNKLCDKGKRLVRLDNKAFDSVLKQMKQEQTVRFNNDQVKKLERKANTIKVGNESLINAVVKALATKRITLEESNEIFNSIDDKKKLNELIKKLEVAETPTQRE